MPSASSLKARGSEMAKREICPVCGESNSTSVAYCRRCSYRLPWADDVEGIDRPSPDGQPYPFESTLKKTGLLPDRTLSCRYCNEPIPVEAKQCPHCGRWLVAAMNAHKIDPMQRNFRIKDVEKLDILPVKFRLSEALFTMAAGAVVFFLLAGLFMFLSTRFH
jgi:hypothetical protein